ncbi:hypothetical protein Micbo1qcDRAFT_178659 [Microdochium bolleyi]|uniref:Uncharacterized protein n=1 Tax=Microdochium bolleyi TaxID=196109 RepID=A0A136IST7_9PEZI|nr:hypothetical protein Micbo1qcDRAFT_178659 [Microdochium bolleyi]
MDSRPSANSRISFITWQIVVLGVSLPTHGDPEDRETSAFPGAPTRIQGKIPSSQASATHNASVGCASVVKNQGPRHAWIGHTTASVTSNRVAVGSGQGEESDSKHPMARAARQDPWTCRGLTRPGSPHPAGLCLAGLFEAAVAAAEAFTSARLPILVLKVKHVAIVVLWAQPG